MKIIHEDQRLTGTRPRKHGENGMATLIFITLLAIMMILVTAEARALNHLHREVKYLEQQQIKRHNNTTGNTSGAAKT
ncbi:MAG: hypothetical protein ABSE48_04135 [Verrucomicrobiota bacterium]